MLCERNETCGREGSASTSPGPRPWFYRCVNRICVAFTHVPGDLERKTHHLFFFLVPCASSPGSCWSLQPPAGSQDGDPNRGLSAPRELGWLRAGAWHLHLAAGSIPGFVFPLLPSIGGKQHSPGTAGGQGGTPTPRHPETLRASGTPPHPARRGSEDGAAS